MWQLRIIESLNWINFTCRQILTVRWWQSALATHYLHPTLHYFCVSILLVQSTLLDEILARSPQLSTVFSHEWFCNTNSIPFCMRCCSTKAAFIIEDPHQVHHALVSLLSSPAILHHQAQGQLFSCAYQVPEPISMTLHLLWQWNTTVHRLHHHGLMVHFCTNVFHFASLFSRRIYV